MFASPRTPLVPGNEDAALASNALVTAANGAIQDSYDAWDVPVVDVASDFSMYDASGRDLPQNVETTCEFTLMCQSVDGEWQLAESPDIHPSNRRYLQIARRFDKLMRSENIR